MPSAMKAENGCLLSMNRITYLLSLRITCLLNQRKTEMRTRGGFLRFMSRIACLLGKVAHKSLPVGVTDAQWLPVISFPCESLLKTSVTQGNQQTSRFHSIPMALHIVVIYLSN